MPTRALRSAGSRICSSCTVRTPTSDTVRSLYMLESQAEYVNDALNTMKRERLDALDVNESVQVHYNKGIQHELQHTVWNKGGCSSWYIDPEGRNSVQWPTFTFKFRSLLEHFDRENYSARKIEKRPGMTTTHYDVVVIGSGFGGQCRRSSPDGEGLPCRGARSRSTVCRRRVARNQLADAKVPVGAVDRMLWGSAYPPSSGRTRDGGSRRRGRIVELRQHVVSATQAVLRRPSVGAHHGLARRTGAVLRPGQTDVGCSHQSVLHSGRCGDERRSRRDGRGGDLHVHPRRCFLRGGRSFRAGPVLRRKKGPNAPVAPNVGDA